MRQRRWIELFSDYDCEIRTTPSLRLRILKLERKLPWGANTSAEMLKGLDKQFEKKEDGGFYFVERI
ncbi:hypothetical protein Tco_0215196 [Tanacetum coccineum]